MALTPARDLVLVREEPPETETESGLQVVRQDEPPDLVTGEVLAVGPRVREVQVGDRVLYNRWTGVETLLGDHRDPGLYLREWEIYAKEETDG